jgi:hypothetical protein
MRLVLRLEGTPMMRRWLIKILVVVLVYFTLVVVGIVLTSLFETTCGC